MVNYFSFNTVAKRYAKGRPYFHPLVIESIVRFTETPRFASAIDVGCGTGQSTIALQTIADRVLGTDISQEMLNEAPLADGIEYRRCPAEALAAPPLAFDIMTVSLVFHWLDRDAFFSEARRVLKPGAWMVISNNSFKGEMAGNPGYKTWNQERYLAKYPSPPRNKSPLTSEEAARNGFEMMVKQSPKGEAYENTVEMTLEQLACYLSTQSNMIAAIESGKETADEALAWLRHELEPFFANEHESLHFKGSITYLRKRDDD